MKTWQKAVSIALVASAAVIYSGYNEHEKGELNKKISNIQNENDKYKQDISNLEDKLKDYNGFILNQFVKDKKYDLSDRLLNETQKREFLQNLEAATEKIFHIGVYKKEGIVDNKQIEDIKKGLPKGMFIKKLSEDTIEFGSLGTGTTLYIDSDTNKAYIVTAGHVIKELDQIIQPGFWDTTTYKKISEETYIQKGDVKIKLKSLICDMKKDFGLLETDGGTNLTAIPYKIGRSEELEKGTWVAFMGFPRGGNIERPSFGWVNDITGYDDGSALVSDYKYNILLSNPTVPGDSGSSVYAYLDGVPEWIGFIHAGYLYSQGLNCAVHAKDVWNYLKQYLPDEKFRN